MAESAVVEKDLKETAAALEATAKEVAKEQADARSIFAKALDGFTERVTKALDKIGGGEVKADPADTKAAKKEAIEKGQKNAGKCPECGGKMDDGECENCDYKEGEDEEEKEHLGKALESVEQYVEAEPVIRDITKAMVGGFSRMHTRITKLEKALADRERERDAFLAALGKSHLALHDDLDLIKAQPLSRARSAVQTIPPTKGGSDNGDQPSKPELLRKLNKAIEGGRADLLQYATMVEIGQPIPTEIVKSLG